MACKITHKQVVEMSTIRMVPIARVCTKYAKSDVYTACNHSYLWFDHISDGTFHDLYAKVV